MNTMLRSTAAAAVCGLLFVLTARPAAAQDTPAVPPGSWIRLADESVAEALSLTDEQKASVAALLQERETALASADSDPARTTVLADYEAKLQQLLTDEQKEQFARLYDEPRITFNFRFQKWSDVLPWVAVEAGLSLAMEEAPEGTFNYSDRRAYTPDEAIDLLNGWLITKGFTLIRRDRQLMCVSLKDGIPAGMIPRVSPEELPDRGRFEFVSVLIPLEGRNPDQVLKEVRPLISEYGQVEALSATKQLLVTDVAHIVQNVQRVALQVPPPSKSQPPPPPPKPVVESYPIEHPNPERVAEIVETMIDGRVFLDEKASQITVRAVPDEQARVRSIIENLQKSRGPDRDPVMKSYPARTDNPAGMLESLRMAVPDAAIHYDAATERFHVFASPADQDKVTSVLLELQRDVTETDRQLHVHSLGTLDPNAVRQMISSVLPDVRLTIDPRTATLIAVGRRSELQAVQTLLDELRRQAGSTEEPVVMPYPLPRHSSLSVISSLLNSLHPDITITADPEHHRLLITAPDSVQKKVSESLARLTDGTDEPRPELRIFPLPDGTSVSAVTELLAAVVPDARVTADASGRRLMVTASAADLETAAAVLERLQAGSAVNGRSLKSYPLDADVEVSTVTNLLATITPAASVTADPNGRRLLIQATRSEHEKIAAAIAQIERDARGETPELRYYPLKKVDGDYAVRILKSIVSRAAVTFEKEARRLSVVALADDHAAVQETLQKLEAAAPEREKRELKIYPVTRAQRARFDAVLQTLRQDIPDLQVLSGDQPGELIIWARPSHQKIIETVLAQLDRDVPAGERAGWLVVPLQKTEPQNVADMLTELFPDMTVRVDDRSRRLIMRVRPDMEDTVRQLVRELDTDLPDDLETKLMVYPVRGLDLSVVQSLLRDQVPGITVIPDAAGRTVIVRGRLEDHRKVAELLDTLRASAPQKKVPKVYPSFHSDPNQERDFFRRAFPDAQITVDARSHRITILATPQDHEQIQATVDALQKAQDDGSGKGDVQIHSLTGVSTSGLLDLLRQAAPQARVVLAGTQLLCWGAPDQQAVVRRIVDGLKDAAGQVQVASFDIGTVGVTTARSILSAVAPGTTFYASQDGRSLIAAVDDTTRRKTEAALKELRSSPAAAGEASMKFYPVDRATAASVRSVVAAAVPGVSLSLSTDGTRLYGKVTDSQDEQIRAVLAQIEKERPFSSDRILKFYSTSRIGSQASSVLNRMVPGIVISSGPEPGQLMVEATPEEHEEIETILQQLAEASRRRDSDIRFYEVDPRQYSDVLGVLRRVVPSVSFSASADRSRLIAVASDEDHAAITAALQKIAQERAFESDRTLEFHSVAEAGAGAAAILRRMVPGAIINTGIRPEQLMVEATPEDHDRIRELLRMLSAAAQDDPRSLKHYVVPRSHLAGARSVISETVPGVTLSASADGTRLFAVVTAEQDARIREALEQLSEAWKDAPEKRTAVFDIAGTDPQAVERALSPLTAGDPDVRITVDARSQRVYVHAYEDRQEEIRNVISQIMAGLEANRDQVVAAYFVGRGNGDEAQDTLSQLYPDAKILTDSSRSMIIATATPDQQETIRMIADQLKNAATATGDAVASAYRTTWLDAATVRQILQGLFRRDGEFSVNMSPDGRTVVALARPDQHRIIEQVLKDLDRAPDDEQYLLRTYRTVPLNSATVRSLLTDLLPRGVTITADRRGEEIVVRASEQHHARISELLEQMGVSGTRADLNLRVYRIAPHTPTVVMAALKPLVSGQVTMSPGADGKQLMVTAPAQEQEKIAALIDQLRSGSPADDRLQIRTYHVGRGLADNVMAVLRPMFPDATLTSDSTYEHLVATALPEQHETIAEVVRQITGRGDGEQKRLARSYQLRDYDGRRMRTILTDTFTPVDRVRIEWDSLNHRIVAVATAEQHELIASIIRDLDPEEGPGARTLQEYDIADLDADAVVEMVQNELRRRDPGATTGRDDGSEKLFVSTTADGHELVRDVISRFDPIPPRKLRVFQLTFMSPWEAAAAVDRMISDDIRQEALRPDVHADENLQQLWVRATAEQLKEIEELLIQLGEVGLTNAAADTADGSVRVLPAPDDSDAAVSRVLALWSRIRPNPIRVVRPPSGGSEAARPDRPDAPRSVPGQFSVPPEEDATEPSDSAADVHGPQPTSEQTADGATRPARAPDAEEGGSPAVRTEDPTNSDSDESDSPSAADASAPPVIIIPGKGQITIASDDTDALDQLEALLRTALARSGSGSANRDFTIRQLRNTSAADVAETIRSVLEETDGLYRFGHVAVVPEQRLNAIIIYGNRADRRRLEPLLDALDSESFSHSQAFQTRLVTLKYSSASRIHSMLRGIYRTQMTSGNVRRRLSIPSGVPADVAAVLRQINATASSPLLIIEPQSETNSLLIKAPPQLLEEVASLAMELDEAVHARPASGVTLVPLEKASSERVMRILSRILK